MFGNTGELASEAGRSAFGACAAFGGEQASREQRREPRSQFRSYQWIAARNGIALPEPADFQQYQCHNISSHGISFFSPSRPESDSLVVALVMLPEIIYVAATVVHCTHVLVRSTGKVEVLPAWSKLELVKELGHEQGVPMFLVGCRFTQRVDLVEKDAG